MRILASMGNIWEDGTQACACKYLIWKYGGDGRDRGATDKRTEPASTRKAAGPIFISSEDALISTLSVVWGVRTLCQHFAFGQEASGARHTRAVGHSVDVRMLRREGW